MVSVLACSGVEVDLGKFHLGPIDMELGRGVTTLVGRNGAGKTTLLRTIVGLQGLRAGRVDIAGSSPHGRHQAKLVYRSIGYVPQGAVVPGGARVGDIVAYSAWLKGVSRSDTASLVASILRELSIEDFARRRVRTMSGGERQRVSLAMALVHRPSILVLDEPSVGLDPVQRVGFRRMLDLLARERAVLLSTHLIEDMGGSNDTIVVLRDGVVAFTGTPAELSANATPVDIGSSDLERGLWRILGSDPE